VLHYCSDERLCRRLARNFAAVTFVKPSHIHLTQVPVWNLCVIDQVRALYNRLDVPTHDGVTTMASMVALNRGDQVLSKLFRGPIMTVLAVEGLKVRCADGRNQQYWFDTIVLERYKGEGEDREAPDDGYRQSQHLACGTPS
jgi:hypothetical protein